MTGGMSVQSTLTAKDLSQIVSNGEDSRHQFKADASYVAKGLLPYWGLGSGIKRAKAAWSAIAFIDDKPGEQFKAIVSFAPEGTTGNGPIETINETINETIKRDETINETIKALPGISLVAIVEKTGKSRATVSRARSALKSSGIVEYRGSKKTGGYYLKGDGG